MNLPQCLAICQCQILACMQICFKEKHPNKSFDNHLLSLKALNWKEKCWTKCTSAFLCDDGFVLMMNTDNFKTCLVVTCKEQARCEKLRQNYPQSIFSGSILWYFKFDLDNRKWAAKCLWFEWGILLSANVTEYFHSMKTKFTLAYSKRRFGIKFYLKRL